MPVIFYVLTAFGLLCLIGWIVDRMRGGGADRERLYTSNPKRRK